MTSNLDGIFHDARPRSDSTVNGATPVCSSPRRDGRPPNCVAVPRGQHAHHMIKVPVPVQWILSPKLYTPCQVHRPHWRLVEGPVAPAKGLSTQHRRDVGYHDDNFVKRLIGLHHGMHPGPWCHSFHDARSRTMGGFALVPPCPVR